MKSTWGLATASGFILNFAAAQPSDLPTIKGDGVDASTARPEHTTSSGAQESPVPSEEPGQESSEVATEETERQDTLHACIAHHEKAQLARLSGGFLEALRELSACAAPECPQALRNDCLIWRDEVQAIAPTLIVVAEDESGDVEEARVTIDGSLTRNKLDGRPIPLDPGTHLVRVELPNGDAKEQRIVLSEGERNRRVAFVFRVPPAEVVPIGAPPTQTIRPIPPGVYLLGATAFVSLGVAVGFGSDAYSKSRTAKDMCAPLCDADVSRAVTERAAIADVALGVAVASAIGAVVVYSYRPERVVPAEAVTLDLVPQAGGGRLSVRGAFR